MKTIIEKAKVKKVIQKNNYQEIFLKHRKETIKLHNCEKDINALLKWSFWGCRSIAEIHYLSQFPIKVYIDGLLLLDIKEQNYPEQLKQKIAKNKSILSAFENKFMHFLQNYPKKESLTAEMLSLKSIWKRAYIGTLLNKLEQQNKLNNDLYQRRCSLLIDLLKIAGTYFFSITDINSDDPLYFLQNSCDFFFYPKKTKKKITEQLNLQVIDGFDEEVLRYLLRFLYELQQRYQKDVSDLNNYLGQITGVFENRSIDRNLIFEYNQELCLYKSWDQEYLPNFILEEQISLSSIKEFLNKQNW